MAVLDKPAAQVAAKKAARAVKAAPAVTLGALNDRLFALRMQKADADKVVKAIEKEIDETEQELMQRLEAEGTDRCSAKLGSISIQTSQEPQVEDWDVFTAFIKKKNFFHLLQRRVSAPAWRELVERGQQPPGTTSFTRKKLHYTAAK